MTLMTSMFADFSPSDWVDLGCVALIVIGLVQGALRGFSGEIARLLGAMAALATALWLRRPLGQVLADHTRLGGAPGQAPLLVFILVFLLALVVALLVRRGMGRFVRLVVTPTTDLLLGILSGGARMLVLLLVLMIVWTWLPDSDSRNLVIGHSRTGRTLAPVVDRLNHRIEETSTIADPLQQWSGKESADRVGPVAVPDAPE